MADKEIDWYDEVFDDEIRLGLSVKERLFDERSEHQRVEVFETHRFGRALAIDGIYMTSEGDEFLYHEMIVHPAMLTARSIETVLIIGGGDGGTAREVLRYPQVKSVTMVEIDGMVVEVSKKYLPTIGGAWDDPRLEVRIGDGIEHVMQGVGAPYDVVLLDGSDPVGPAEGLFNRDFYEGVERILKPGGVFALQSESPILMPGIFASLQKTLGEVFPIVKPYFGPVFLYGAGMWSWTYATDTTDPMAIDASRAAAIVPDCKCYNEDVHRGAFAQPNFVRRALE